MLLENNRQDWKVLCLTFLYFSETDINIFECANRKEFKWFANSSSCSCFIQLLPQSVLTAQPLIMNSLEEKLWEFHFICIHISFFFFFFLNQSPTDGVGHTAGNIQDVRWSSRCLLAHFCFGKFLHCLLIWYCLFVAIL